ncbi:hypothetical protein TWF191_004003 [Orbilia oligospora]|uniref:Ketoreductase (KR) domain-containing protein n=1 Tax=Orbilia oligospora TaxID=2813651 RepID=A0A7C8R1E1_ORBOL|nr:hypothetical protein TWF191_004003 [Orbilia oligospora]
MIPLATIKAANATLSTRLPSPICVFLGGTTGIGYFTLQKLVASTVSPKVYYIGRTPSNAEVVQKRLEEINPKGTYIFVQCDILVIKNINKACEEILQKEKEINLLWLSAGMFRIGHPDTPDGLNFMAAISYFSHMKFVINLLPLLKASAANGHFSRVIRILAGGMEWGMNPNDLEMSKSYFFTSRLHHVTSTTVALDYLAKENPEISFIHASAGSVKTEGQDMPGVFGFLVRTVLWVAGRWILIPADESGERNLFNATSEIYPASKNAEEVIALLGGEGKGEGEEVAVGLDGVKGSGCYTIHANGTAKSGKKVLLEYRETGFREKFWEHTLSVYKRIEESYEQEAGTA